MGRTDGHDKAGFPDVQRPQAMEHGDRGHAVPDIMRHAYVDLAGEVSQSALECWLRRRDYTCLCINDSGGSTRRSQAALSRFFEEYFPLPSVWVKEPLESSS